MSTLIERQHITSTPGVCGGKPCIAGTRIRVQDIYVWHELQSQSAAEIVRDFPQLSLADVHAALTYFYDHRDEILKQMREADELVSRMKREAGPNLLERIRAENGDA